MWCDGAGDDAELMPGLKFKNALHPTGYFNTFIRAVSLKNITIKSKQSTSLYRTK